MIGDAIVNHVVDVLEAALIANISTDDDTRAGVVKTGDLQGDPDPDEARISVTVYENDPDAFYSGQTTGLSGTWNDEIAEVECGGDHGGATWNRRFTVKARCLLANTQEELADARRIASVIKSRIERALIEASWDGVEAANDSDEVIEYVSRPVVAKTMRSEALQGGGPPDSYDYTIKVRFDVQTTMIL